MYAFKSNVIYQIRIVQKKHPQCSKKFKKVKFITVLQPNRVNCTTVQNYQLFFYRCSEKRIFFGGSFGKNLTSDNILWWVGSITAIRMAQSVVHYIGHKFFGAGDEASPKRWPHRRPEPQYLKGDPMEILHFYRQTIMGT